jgi:hypothetical protein
MKAWTYAKGYKSAYVALMLLNLAIICGRWASEHAPSRIAVALFVANILSWIALLHGSDWGFVSEVVLSIGRMLAILACALPLFLLDLVAWMSPVAHTVWMPLLVFDLWIRNNVTAQWSYLVWFAICLPLLG